MDKGFVFGLGIWLGKEAGQLAAAAERLEDRCVLLSQQAVRSMREGRIAGTVRAAGFRCWLQQHLHLFAAWPSR